MFFFDICCLCICVLFILLCYFVSVCCNIYFTVCMLQYLLHCLYAAIFIALSVCWLTTLITRTEINLLICTHSLAWDWIWDSVMKDRRLAACAIARPYVLWKPHVCCRLKSGASETSTIFDVPSPQSSTRCLKYATERETFRQSDGATLKVCPRTGSELRIWLERDRA
jgi:hypothetical protein